MEASSSFFLMFHLFDFSFLFLFFLLGIALMWTTRGKVYNGITDDDFDDDILNLSIVLPPVVLGTGGLSCRRTRASGRFSRVAARVLPGVSRAPLCTLPLLFWSL